MDLTNASVNESTTGKVREKEGEQTGHQLDDMHISLQKDYLDALRVAFFKFALQVAAAVLVLAEAVKLSAVSLQRYV
jgi:hypothetical protein